jgi:cystinosin
MDASAQQGFGEILSHFIGWAYFIAWSASFYPQAILNWRRKSVQGLSMDFIYLNVLGFLCYSIFNLSFFYSEDVQEEYRKRNDGQDNLVRANDVFFAVHALILSSFTLFQTLIYKVCDQQITNASCTPFMTPIYFLEFFFFLFSFACLDLSERESKHAIFARNDDRTTRAPHEQQCAMH